MDTSAEENQGSGENIDAMADARRQERIRMRTNLGAQYRYDKKRPGVGEDGYSSSDIEEDIQAAMEKFKEKADMQS